MQTASRILLFLKCSQLFSGSPVAPTDPFEVQSDFHSIMFVEDSIAKLFIHLRNCTTVNCICFVFQLVALDCVICSRQAARCEQNILQTHILYSIFHEVLSSIKKRAGNKNTTSSPNANSQAARGRERQYLAGWSVSKLHHCTGGPLSCVSAIVSGHIHPEQHVYGKVAVSISDIHCQNEENGRTYSFLFGFYQYYGLHKAWIDCSGVVLVIEPCAQLRWKKGTRSSEWPQLGVQDLWLANSRSRMMQ